MVPKEAEAKKRTRDKTRIEESEGGDATLRGLAVLARAKQDEKKQKADAVVARKEERALKKAELEASAAAAAATTALLSKLQDLQESYIQEQASCVSKFGCPKCEWEGSTCCDPDKKESKRKAQAEFAGKSWPLSAADDKKLPENAKFCRKAYNGFLQTKKDKVKEENQKIARGAFKKQMEDWTKNMQLGKMLLDLKLAQAAAKAAKEATAEKATAEAKEAKEKEPEEAKNKSN